MARKRRIQLSNITAVAASGTALLEVPLSFGRMHYLVLQHGYTGGSNTIASAAANLAEVRVILNGTVVRTFSGTQLRDMNLLNGTAYDCIGLPNTAPGVAFPLFFAEPSRKDARDQDALAWSSKPINSFKIEVAFGAATNPTLKAYAVVDDVILNGANKDLLYVKWIRQPFNASGTEFDITTIDRRGYLQQVSLYPDSGGGNPATEVQVKKDSIIVHELTASANAALLLHHGMTPAAAGRTANIFDIVFDHDDLLGSSEDMNGSRDLVVKVKAAAAMSGTVTGIVQRLEALD